MLFHCGNIFFNVKYISHLRFLTKKEHNMNPTPDKSEYHETVKTPSPPNPLPFLSLLLPGDGKHNMCPRLCERDRDAGRYRAAGVARGGGRVDCQRKGIRQIPLHTPPCLVHPWHAPPCHTPPLTVTNIPAMPPSPVLPCPSLP